MTKSIPTRDVISYRISAALTEFGVESEIRPDDTWDQIDVDSLDLAELAQIIDDEFGVELRHLDIQAVQTVGQAVDLIAARAG
jgi:acyl carrier protein